MNTVRYLAASLVLMIIGSVACGCGGRPLLGKAGAHPRSYDYEQQRVTIEYIQTLDGLLTNPNALAVDDTAWQDHVKGQIRGLALSEGDRDEVVKVLGIEGVIATAAAGYVIDQAKSQIDEEAKLYEAQWGTTKWAAGFWDDPSSTDAKPRFYGFKVTRTTKASVDAGHPYASQLVCALVPAALIDPPPSELIQQQKDYRAYLQKMREYTARMKANPTSEEKPPKEVTAPKWPTDRRVFAIVPLYYHAITSRAKVLGIAGNDRIDSKFDINLDATWIDEQDGMQVAHHERIATASCKIEDYSLREMQGKRQPKPALVGGQIAGWFAGIPICVEGRKGEAKYTNGAFELNVLCTEADASEAREVFERGSNYINENRESWMKKVAQNQ